MIKAIIDKLIFLIDYHKEHNIQNKQNLKNLIKRTSGWQIKIVVIERVFSSSLFLVPIILISIILESFFPKVPK